MESDQEVVERRSLRTCAACGGTGHISSNKKCPNYGKNSGDGVNKGNKSKKRPLDVQHFSDSDHDIDGPDDEIDDDIEDQHPFITQNGYIWTEEPFEEAPAQVENRGRGRPRNDENPELPKFKNQNKCGPKLSEFEKVPHETQFDIFKIFWHDPIINQFVLATNAYGRQNNPKWVDVCVDEFYGFLAVIIALGIVNFPNRDIAWGNDGFSFQFAKSVMSKERFSELLNAWHYLDVTVLSERECEEMKKKDPFWLVSKLAEVQAKRFGVLFVPYQYLDIDEQSVGYVGRHVAIVYNPDKPHKYHFKLYVLNDSKTGYMMNFKLYPGAAEVRPEGVSATLYPFTILLADENLHHKNHILETDNWYTQLEAMEWCIPKGIWPEGTIKPSRKGVPFKFARKGRDVPERGTVRLMRTMLRCGKPCYYFCWQDAKCVSMATSIKVLKKFCIRKIKINGRWHRQQFPCPSTIMNYNANMGGTDSIDQRIGYITNLLRVNKWPPKLLMHFLAQVVVNSQICFKELYPGNDRLTVIEYAKTLCYQMAAMWINRKRPTDLISTSYQRTYTIQNRPDMQISRHYVVKRLSENDGDGTWIRRRCRKCNKKSCYYCKECNAYYCIDERVNVNGETYTCFDVQHVLT